MWKLSLNRRSLGCVAQRRVPGVLLRFLLLTAPAVAGDAIPIVSSVSLVGTRLPVTLKAQAGQPYDAYAIGKDVRALWSTGRFEDIRVETAQSAGRVSIIFR